MSVSWPDRSSRKEVLELIVKKRNSPESKFKWIQREKITNLDFNHWTWVLAVISVTRLQPRIPNVFDKTHFGYLKSIKDRLWVARSMKIAIFGKISKNVYLFIFDSVKVDCWSIIGSEVDWNSYFFCSKGVIFSELTRLAPELDTTT